MNQAKTSLRKTDFSKRTTLVFATVFALIGGYTIFRSFAAGPSCTVTVSSVSAAQSAVSSATGGSVVCMSAGSYGAISLTGTHSGNVTFEPDPALDPNNGGKVTLGSVTVTGSYITVHNFYVTGGIDFSPPASHDSADHNDVTDSPGNYGIDVSCNSAASQPGCSYITMNGNRVHDLQSTSADDGDALRLDGWANATITNNEITRVEQQPGGNQGHTDCLQSYNANVTTHDIVYDHNYIHDDQCQVFFLKDGDVATNVSFTDNLSLRTTNLGDSDTSFWLADNTQGAIIRNNTMQGGGSAMQAIGTAPNPSAIMDHNVFDQINNLGGYSLSENHNIFTAGNQWSFTPDSTDQPPSYGVTVNPTYMCGSSCGNGTVAGDDYRLASNPNGIGVDWAPSQYTYGPVNTSGTSSAANVYVATNGNDSTCARGDNTKPCATFSKAYQLSQCGDTIQVAAGTYPQQTITDVNGLDNCSSYVTFQPATGATVTLSCAPDSDGGCFALTLGSVNWTNNGGNGPSWISIHGININGNTWIGGGNHNIQLVNVNAGGGNIRDVTNVLLQNDNFGPSDGPGVTPRTTNSDANWVFDGSGISTISITGSSFHDFLIGSTHFECVAINNVATLSVTGTSFNNCQIYGLDFGLYNQATSLLVDNDTFSNITNGWAVNLQSQRVDNLTVSNSTFGPGQYISQSSGTATNIKIINNNFQVAATCVGGATYSGNTWASGTCPGDSAGGGGGTTTGPLTIGETTVLPNADNGNANLLLAQSATLSQTATIQSLSFYVTNAAGKLHLGIYDSSGPGGSPGALKAQTAEITPVTGWNTANVTSQVSLPAGTYWLAYLPSDDNLAFTKNTDSSSSGKLYSFTYGSLPSTFSTSPSSTSSHWSFYATLNAGAGTTTVPGDTNGDGHVTITDLSTVLSHFGQSGQSLSTGDTNGDGVVTITDLSAVLSHFGQ